MEVLGKLSLPCSSSDWNFDSTIKQPLNDGKFLLSNCKHAPVFLQEPYFIDGQVIFSHLDKEGRPRGEENPRAGRKSDFTLRLVHRLFRRMQNE